MKSKRESTEEWRRLYPLSLEDAAEQWHRLHPGDDKNAAPYAGTIAILRAERIVYYRLTEILGALKLSLLDWTVLACLKAAQNGALPLGQVADLLNVHGTTITNAADRLEKVGYLDRVRHSTDRRTILARISKSGEKHLTKANSALAKEQFGLSELTVSEVVKFTGSLLKISPKEDQQLGAQNTSARRVLRAKR